MSSMLGETSSNRHRRACYAAYSEKALYTNLDICAGEVFMDYDNRDNTLCDVTFNLKVGI
jgi:hypothetical protein